MDLLPGLIIHIRVGTGCGKAPRQTVILSYVAVCALLNLIDLIYTGLQSSGGGQIGNQGHPGGLQAGFGCQKLILGLRQFGPGLLLGPVQFVPAFLEILFAAVDLLQAVLYFFLSVLQFLLSVFQFPAALLQFFLRIPHLIVYGRVDLPVQRIHFLLADDYIDALFQKAHCAGTGHALQALHLRHQHIR